jgi:hypothetical protein
MTLIQPVGIPSDIRICGHWREDHVPQCIVIEEDELDCLCTCFTPDDDDDWGYWYTDDEGHKLEGRA